MRQNIAVFGAGSIGAFTGGALIAAGADVVLIGRARMRERIAQNGLKLSDLWGSRVEIPAARVRFAEDPSALQDADLVIVSVKSADTDNAATVIAQYAPVTAIILSLQNGVGNDAALRAALPGRTVIGGMVPFNVLQTEDGRLHRGTAGELMVEANPALAPWLALFAKAHLPLQERADFSAVQWGKLLVNLNNAVNALSGVPLLTELSQKMYRRCLALTMEEGLRVLARAGIVPAKVTQLSPRLLPWVMRLPDGLYRRVAAAALRIDPEARSSMWEDLQAGRRTEVDYLNGAIIQLAHTFGMDAPLNRRMLDLVRAAEQGGRRDWDGASLYRAITNPG